jgi:hypothetical protein
MFVQPENKVQDSMSLTDHLFPWNDSVTEIRVDQEIQQKIGGNARIRVETVDDGVLNYDPLIEGSWIRIVLGQISTSSGAIYGPVFTGTIKRVEPIFKENRVVTEIHAEDETFDLKVQPMSFAFTRGMTAGQMLKYIADRFILFYDGPYSNPSTMVRRIIIDGKDYGMQRVPDTGDVVIPWHNGYWTQQRPAWHTIVEIAESVGWRVWLEHSVLHVKPYPREEAPSLIFDYNSGYYNTWSVRFNEANSTNITDLVAHNVDDKKAETFEARTYDTDAVKDGIEAAISSYRDDIQPRVSLYSYPKGRIYPRKSESIRSSPIRDSFPSGFSLRDYLKWNKQTSEYPEHPAKGTMPVKLYQSSITNQKVFRYGVDKGYHPDYTPAGSEITELPDSADAADTIMDARQEARDWPYTVELETIGHWVIAPQEEMLVRGPFNSPYDGIWYCTRATHTINSRDGYRTTVEGRKRRQKAPADIPTNEKWRSYRESAELRNRAAQILKSNKTYAYRIRHAIITAAVWPELPVPDSPVYEWFGQRPIRDQITVDPTIAAKDFGAENFEDLPPAVQARINSSSSLPGGVKVYYPGKGLLPEKYVYAEFDDTGFSGLPGRIFVVDIDRVIEADKLIWQYKQDQREFKSIKDLGLAPQQ